MLLLGSMHLPALLLDRPEQLVEFIFSYMAHLYCNCSYMTS